MPYDPNDSGEYVRPLPVYLDNLVVEHPELGTTEFWKVLLYETSKLRNFVARADSAAALAKEAQKRAPSSEPKRAKPVVADAAEASQMERIHTAIADLENRLDAFEARKAEEAAQQERAAKALALAEAIAETTPAQLLDSLPPAPNQRLN